MQRARRLVWVTGQPGCGKTTLGNAMKATRGWLHYDGDMYTHGGHPIQDTGIPTAEMLAARDPELTKVYLEMGEKGFNAVFRGERPPLQVWIPFHDLMCADVLRRWEENPGASIIVTQAVYPRELRAYISSKVPFLEWVVMDDVAQGSVNRKLQQIKDAAAAEGQSMAQYLSKFGDQWKDPVGLEERVRASVAKCQVGQDPAETGAGELQVDIKAGMTQQDVLKLVCELLRLP